MEGFAILPYCDTLGIRILLMKSINILSVSEARAQLPKIIQLVATGEDVVIVNRRNKQKFQMTCFERKLPTRSRSEIPSDPV
jgi:hypothetical protein